MHSILRINRCSLEALNLEVITPDDPCSVVSSNTEKGCQLHPLDRYAQVDVGRYLRVVDSHLELVQASLFVASCLADVSGSHSDHIALLGKVVQHVK